MVGRIVRVRRPPSRLERTLTDSAPTPALAKQITAVLLGLVIFDLVLTTWAFAAPDLWFALWHGVPYEGNDPEGFLRRCGANWAAFLLFQSIALWRWRRETFWVAVVAGVRLSDIFTDVTYAFFARDLTWAGAILLPGGSLMNVIVGFWLLAAYRRFQQSA